LKLFFVIGTRPEAIKLAPVIILAKESQNFEVFVCSTGQHKEMLDQVFNLFQFTCDVDLDVMHVNNSLAKTTAAIMSKLNPIIYREKPLVCQSFCKFRKV
jgi:UDP-N-acetylglucosamine 2-epimerase (non-hydrolysing)